MGESRTELLAWLNDLCQLSYTRIEQCGTGAAYCQVLDAIYRDCPLSRVKFGAKHEYEYMANYKVLQNVLDKHGIDNAVPVERLMKCKFQDNLEFLQWLKKHWDQHYAGGTYDAVARRKGEAGGAGAGAPKRVGTASKAGSASRSAATSRAGSSRLGAPSSATALADQRALAETREELAQMSAAFEQVEQEREFYFGKLREIEILVQAELDGPGAANGTTSPEIISLLKTIQGVLYKTAEGFEVPDEAAG
ncbi:hypothetical protein CXG81DRAFT_5077, partial [Caulochytrium protostelioides]